MIIGDIIHASILTEWGVLPEYNCSYVGAHPMCFVPAYPGLPWNLVFTIGQTPHLRGSIIYIELLVHGRNFGSGKLVNRRFLETREGHLPATDEKLRFFFPSWASHQEKDDIWEAEDYETPEWLIEVKVWRCEIERKLKERSLSLTSGSNTRENTGLTPSRIFNRNTLVRIVEKKGSLLGHLTWFYRLPEFFYGAILCNGPSALPSEEGGEGSESEAGLSVEPPEYHYGPDTTKECSTAGIAEELPPILGGKRAGRAQIEALYPPDGIRRSQQDPIPVGWEIRRPHGGSTYFVDHNSGQTTWIDPREKVDLPPPKKASGITLESIRKRYTDQQINYLPKCLLPETLPAYTSAKESWMIELLAILSAELQRYQIGYNLMESTLSRQPDGCIGGWGKSPDDPHFLQANRGVLLDNKRLEYQRCLAWLSSVSVSSLERVVMVEEYTTKEVLYRGVPGTDAVEDEPGSGRRKNSDHHDIGSGWRTEGGVLLKGAVDSEEGKLGEQETEDARCGEMALRRLFEVSGGLRKLANRLKTS